MCLRCFPLLDLFPYFLCHLLTPDNFRWLKVVFYKDCAAFLPIGKGGRLYNSSPFLGPLKYLTTVQNHSNDNNDADHADEY
jgi:hypothetical protein